MTCAPSLRSLTGPGTLLVLAGMLLVAGCVEQTVQPVDPLADIKGTWKGTRHQLVLDELGDVVPDTTAMSDLTIVVGDNAVTFIDSEDGHLPATVTSLSADELVFTLTDGATRWTETGSRSDRVMNGVERFSPSGDPAGVWAVVKQ